MLLRWRQAAPRRRAARNLHSPPPLRPFPSLFLLLLILLLLLRTGRWQARSGGEFLGGSSPWLFPPAARCLQPRVLPCRAVPCRSRRRASLTSAGGGRGRRGAGAEEGSDRPGAGGSGEMCPSPAIRRVRGPSSSSSLSSRNFPAAGGTASCPLLPSPSPRPPLSRPPT